MNNLSGKRMETIRFEEILSIGETICIKFKRCGNGVESDANETMCSFLNRFGGDMFLGLEDNGQVSGVLANPILASFFRKIGLADKLGSGVRNMYKYTRYYYDGKPQFLKEDIFQIVLDDIDDTVKCIDQLENGIDRLIVEFMLEDPRISFIELTEAIGFSGRAIAVHVKSLAERHIIARKGNNKNGYWEVNIQKEMNDGNK